MEGWIALSPGGLWDGVKRRPGPPGQNLLGGSIGFWCPWDQSSRGGCQTFWPLGSRADPRLYGLDILGGELPFGRHFEVVGVAETFEEDALFGMIPIDQWASLPTQCKRLGGIEPESTFLLLGSVARLALSHQNRTNTRLKQVVSRIGARKQQANSNKCIPHRGLRWAGETRMVQISR